MEYELQNHLYNLYHKEVYIKISIFQSQFAIVRIMINFVLTFFFSIIKSISSDMDTCECITLDIGMCSS